jgi:Cu/Ag efflux protein CusF
MKKLLLICALAIAFTLISGATFAQTTSPADASAAARPKQEQTIGEVVTIDATTGEVTIKTESGKTFSVNTSDQTSYLRIAPGERNLANAAKITRTDIKVGDRVLVRPTTGAASVEGQPFLARQLIVISKESLAARDEQRAREDARRRINGRITSINPQTKEITITARSRDAMDTVIINASASNVRLLRYAPDSSRREDAQPISFSDLKVGDQLRAVGDRSSDGTHFTPEEIVTGAFTRTIGTVQSTDVAKNEITIKDDQSGKTFTIAIGQRSVLHRLPADFEERMAKFREEAQQRRAQAQAQGTGGVTGANATPNGQTGERRNERTGGNQEGANGGQGRGQRGGGFGGGFGGPGGGGAFQRLFEGMPAITVADLKKGDMVVVQGTPSATDASRITAINLTTGDAALMKRMQQFQGRPGGDRNMSPGLPGSVVGTGSGSERDRP